jgi:hypothetical protein
MLLPFIDEHPPFLGDRKLARAAWKAWAAEHEYDTLDAQSLVPPPFDPYNGLFGVYPTLNPSGMPVLVPGSTGAYVAYMQGVLYFKANQPCRPAANPANWGFGPITASCVVSFKRFFGIIPAWSTNSTVNAATWSAIQYCAINL